jgi:predicted nuclease of predicted toxin-antitoxin system
MKLLLDANISFRLIPDLKLHFQDCFHVDQIGLVIPAKDIEIWHYALLNHLLIITNDEDFLNLANVKGFPPKVILLRTGNQSNLYIKDLLIRHKQVIEDFLKLIETGVLEIY